MEKVRNKRGGLLPCSEASIFRPGQSVFESSFLSEMFADVVRIHRRNALTQVIFCFGNKDELSKQR